MEAKPITGFLQDFLNRDLCGVRALSFLVTMPEIAVPVPLGGSWSERTRPSRRESDTKAQVLTSRV